MPPDSTNECPNTRSAVERGDADAQCFLDGPSHALALVIPRRGYSKKCSATFYDDSTIKASFSWGGESYYAPMSVLAFYQHVIERLDQPRLDGVCDVLRDHLKSNGVLLDGTLDHGDETAPDDADADDEEPTDDSAVRRSAEQGAAGAQYCLGLMYRMGEDVRQDYVEAAGWYRRAAEQGSAGAQHALGSAYANGEGLPQDYVLAYMWLNLAAAQITEHREGFVTSRDAVAAKLTPDQLAEAQRMAREWKPTPEQ